MTKDMGPHEALVAKVQLIIEAAQSDGTKSYQDAATKCITETIEFMGNVRVLKPTRDMGCIAYNIFEEARCGNILVLQPSSLDALQDHLYDTNIPETSA